MLPEKYYEDYDLIENIKLFLNDYEALCENKRDIDIVKKKFAIGNKIFTLKEIGILYGLSKERARQILAAEIREIKKMLNGELNLKHNCKCRPEFVEQFSKLSSFLGNRSIISYSSINSFFNENFNSQIKEVDKNYFRFLSNVLGYDKITYLNNLIYYKFEKFSVNTIKQLLNTTKRTLRNNILPLDTSSVAIRVKDKLKNPSIETSDVLNILEQIIEFEKIVDNGNEYYQLKFDIIYSVGDMGVRILHENKRSMHYKEIALLVNQKLQKIGSDKLIKAFSLKLQFAQLPLTIARGKTGYWSLKQWGYDSSTIFSLIKDALISCNSPMTSAEIFEYSVKKQKEVKRHSITSIALSNKNAFVRLVNKKYILRDWANRYKALIPTEPFPFQKRYDHSKIMGHIVEIFKSYSTNKINSGILRAELKNIGLTFPDSTYHQRILCYPILEKPFHFSREILLKEDHELILSSQIVTEEKTLKA